MKKYTKILSLTMALVMTAACLIACGGPLPSPEKQAEAAVDSCFKALQAGDMEAAAKYTNGADFTDVGEADEDGIVNNLILKEIFGKLEYKILSSQKVDDNTVAIKAEITNLDMKPVFTEFFTQALKYVLENTFSSNPPSEEEIDQEMIKMFEACISKEDLAKVTNEAEIKVVKTEERWTLEVDDALLDALLGGLGKAVEEIQKSFQS